MKHQLLALIALVGVVAIAGIVLRKPDMTNCPDFTEASAEVNGVTISIAIADTPAAKAKGLSGCERMPRESGVLFEFDRRAYPSFWMKDMLIAIDIIWIADGAVVGVEHAVPPPQLGDSQDSLPTYKPPRPVDAVLEVAAGEAERLGIAVGSVVEY